MDFTALVPLASLALSSLALAQEKTPLELEVLPPVPGLSDFGHAVDVWGATAVVGEPDSFGARNGAAYVLALQEGHWSITQTLTPSLGREASQFGLAVALEQDLLVIGAPDASLPSQKRAGLAFVYERQGTSWVEIRVLRATFPYTGDDFGREVAVDATNRIVAISAPRAAPIGGGTPAGVVWIFQEVNGAWGDLGVELTFPGTMGGTVPQYGESIAVSDGRLLVGAPYDGTLGNAVGSAFVFESVAGVWTLMQQLLPQVPEVAERFGYGVAIEHKRLLVSSQFGTGAAPGTGRVRVFDRIAGTWTETALFSASDGGSMEFFGASVDLDHTGTLAVVSAAGHDHPAADQGAAYVFRRRGDLVWEQVAELQASDGGPFEYYGVAAVHDRWIAVGASLHGHHGIGQGPGAVYFYPRPFSRIMRVFEPLR